MERDRPDLAEHSWKIARKKFRNYPTIVEFIEYLQLNGFCSKYHASSSLSMLIVSPRYRYDAAVDTLSILEFDGELSVKYLKHGTNEESDREILENSVQELIPQFQKLCERCSVEDAL